MNVALPKEYPKATQVHSRVSPIPPSQTVSRYSAPRSRGPSAPVSTS